MRLFILLFTLLLSANTVTAQKKTLQEKALQEIDSLVANSLDLLGKTDSAIMAAGRPASIIGGDEWKADLVKLSGKNNMDAKATIIIGTGCGVLMIVVAAKSGLAYNFNYIPHKKTKLDGQQIMAHLSNKYTFDKAGATTFQAKDASYVGLMMMQGGLMMVALKEDKKTLRFEE